MGRHADLDHLLTVADIWRALPLDATVLRMHWWRVPTVDVPHDEDGQIDWLYQWWERIDRWVARNQRGPRSGARRNMTLRP